jgi:metal-sulfur cluster biosynthetic enzyme
MCSITKEQVFEAVSTVIDPEVGFNLVEMGLIYDAIIEAESCNVVVVMTLSTRGCPLHQMIKQWVQQAVEKLDGVGTVEVEVVWEPEWNISMADKTVQDSLGGGMPS